MTPRRAAAPLTAYLLHRWDWSESSLILDVFTREAGRMVVAAKGAKRPYSQLRGVLLPFQRVLITLTRGDDDTEVRTLRTADWAGGQPLIGGPALLAGFYLNELLMKLLARNDAHGRLFDLYALTLAKLADPTAAAPALRAFELSLLREVGVLPDLAHETATLAAVQVDRSYRLEAQDGLRRALGDSAPGAPGSLWLAVQQALDDDALQAGLTSLQRACQHAPAALKTMLRQLLQHHLGGAELRSRQVLRDARQVLWHGAPDARPEPPAWRSFA